MCIAAYTATDVFMHVSLLHAAHGSLETETGVGLIDVQAILTKCIHPCAKVLALFSDMDINELTSVLHKYKTPVPKCCILTCC